MIVEGILRGLTAFIYAYWLYTQICSEGSDLLSEVDEYHFRPRKPF